MPRTSNKTDFRKGIGNKKLGDIRIGTWNIRTLFKAGAMEILIDEVKRYKLLIVALQEIKWPGSGSVKSNDTIIFYSGGTSPRHEFGVGFLINVTYFVSEFGADIFSTDGMVLFCKVCNVAVASEKKFTIQQHISRDKHARGIQRKLNEVKQNNQVLLSNFTNNSDQSSFNLELCETLLAANIPLAKLNNTNFRNFLEKNIKFKIPDESTLRKNYVEKCYLNTIRNIRHYVGDKKIWVSVDETTDVEGHYVVNIVIGTLEAKYSGKIFLLYSDVLEKTNHSTIAKAFDKAMFTLWPEGIKHDNVLIFVSDAASYMLKAGRAICALYSKMVHVTCVAHAIHRVAEEIRSNFQDVNKLISCVKKIFLKSPYRTQMFKTLAPGIPLSPEPGY
ncbi:hypothetical protein QTP88_002523 [Uroleucon formosanum]